MNIALVVDINTNRDKPEKIIIQSVTRNGNSLEPVEENDIITKMAALCEGICTLIHCAESEGIKPSHQSIKDCIKHITDGFIDASYVGKTIKNE